MRETCDTLLGRLLAVTLLATTLVGLGGCNIGTPVMWLLTGPEQKEPEYVLPTDSTVVVFLDDRGSVIPRARLRSLLTMSTTNTLLEQKGLVAKIVTPDAAGRVASQEEYGHLIPVDEIGRRVGADIVIYATVLRWDLIDDGYPRPLCILSVQVVDCIHGTVLWPEGGSPHVLTAQMGTKTSTRYDTSAAVAQLEDTLAKFAGLRLAQLFFKHEENPLDAEINY